MLLPTTVNAIALIERGCLEVNPVIEFETRDDIKKCAEAKVKDEQSYIYLPYEVIRTSIDLTAYLAIRTDDVSAFIPYSKDKEATKVTKLRLYCQTDVEIMDDTLKVIDLTYEDTPGPFNSYKLKRVVVYDEYNYAYPYNIIKMSDPDSHIHSIVLNIETMELAQNIISKTGR